MYKCLKIQCFIFNRSQQWCLPRAICEQVYHHKHTFTPEMAMRQVRFHMLRHPLKFYKYIEQELLETGESYESYCYNVYMEMSGAMIWWRRLLGTCGILQ